MWTRRKFLEATGAGVGAALAVTPAAAGLPASPPEPPRPARNKKSPAETAVTSARAVLERQLGPRASDFDLKVIDSELAARSTSFPSPMAASRSPAAVASPSVAGRMSTSGNPATRWITWSGRHLDLPATLPDIPHRRVVSPYKFVQYFNPCTYGYTMAFWDWARWERELDWMALHGINMPLAMEGQEAIWQRVWLSLGLTQAEVDQFSTGPGHLPWHRMGNINNFDARCPQASSTGNVSCRAGFSTGCANSA